MAQVPQYKKIDGKWYSLWATYINKLACKKSAERINKPTGSFSARAVPLAKKYRTKQRKHAIYRRGRKRGIVYDSSTPSPKNPVPKPLKDWLIRRYA